MQTVFLQMLQKHAASAVDDTFGNAGGAAGVENVKRMIEGQWGELRFAARLVEVVPQADAGVALERVGAGAGTAIGHDQQVFEAGQLGQHFVDLVDLVDGLARVLIPGTDHQQLGLDLAKTVDDAVGAEFRRGT
ncbi:hypothetical protein D3C77_576280 [compost metagenome]